MSGGGAKASRGKGAHHHGRPPEKYAPPDGDAPHNYRTNVADVGFYHFGLSLLSMPVVLPLFALKVGAPEWVLGSLPAIAILGINLPQFAAAYWIQRMPRCLPYLFWTGLFQRLPWAILTLSIFVFWETPGVLGWMFPLLYGISWAMLGVGKGAWARVISTAIPESQRGRFRAAFQFWGSLMAVGAGVILARVLGKPEGAGRNEWGFLFAIASLCIFVSWWFFMRNREKPRRPPADLPPTFPGYVRSMWAIVKGDRNLLRLAGVQILALSTSMGLAHFMVYAVKRFRAGEGNAGALSLTMTLGTGLTALVLGRLADRWGHRINLMVSTAAAASAMALALVAPSMWILAPAFLLLAIHQSSFNISSENMIFDLAGPDRVPAYMGLINTFSSPFVLGYAVLGTFLAHRGLASYDWIFAISLGCNLTAAFLLATMEEGPGRKNPLPAWLGGGRRRVQELLFGKRP
ncbi:MAG: MFS transporter [Spirochaetes bacterium]|nr:MFS transporter [Spirochaetota bacterium]